MNGTLHAQQAAQSRDADLPDAPAVSTLLAAEGEQAATGSISGIILDVNGGIVPGAKVSLVQHGQMKERTANANSEGYFQVTDLPQGIYTATITAENFQAFVAPDVEVQVGQNSELPTVAMRIAVATQQVNVTVTRTELATEQIQVELSQRAFGVLPNFYTSYVWNAAPLTTRLKYQLALRSALDPTAFLGCAVIAGIEQAQNTYKGYGQGAQGYAKRFGAAYADDSISRMLGSAILPSLLHQDPRYFYKGSGTRRSRIYYAIASSVATRGDSGRWQPNYSHILGSFGSGAISNAYHPAGDRGVMLTIDNGLLETAGNAANNIIREFFLKRVTPKIPDYANGKPTP